MLDGLKDVFNNYIQQLPSKIPQSVLESGIYSFFISAIIAKNIEVGAFCAALSCTVSLISSLTLPIFKEALSDKNGNMKWYHQTVHIFSNLAIAQWTINYLISSNNINHPMVHKVHIFAGALFTIALNLAVNGFKDRSTDESFPYILVGENIKIF